MKDPVNYMLSLLLFALGIMIGMSKVEPVYSVTEIVFANSPDTIWMSLSGCIDMINK